MTPEKIETLDSDQTINYENKCPQSHELLLLQSGKFRHHPR